jgi:hypothetical protein
LLGDIVSRLIRKLNETSTVCYASLALSLKIETDRINRADRRLLNRHLTPDSLLFSGSGSARSPVNQSSLLFSNESKLFFYELSVKSDALHAARFADAFDLRPASPGGAA